MGIIGFDSQNWEDFSTILSNYIEKLGGGPNYLDQTKFILATLFNLNFTYFFTKNIIEKHLIYFSKDRIRKLSFYVFGVVVFVIIVLYLPRIMIRNSITMFVFGKITYLSLVLSILWMLPFMSYIINLGVKYITKQNIKKEDLHFFNKNLANSINIYSICLILVLVYIHMHYTAEILGILFYNIYQILSGSTIGPQYVLPPAGAKMPELYGVFDKDKGEMKTSNVNLNGENKEVNHWTFLKGSFLDLNIWKIPENFGFSGQSLHLPIGQFDPNHLNKPLASSFNFSHSEQFFTSASIVAHGKSNNQVGVFLNIVDWSRTGSHSQAWLKVIYVNNDIVKNCMAILESKYGSIFSNFDKNMFQFIEIGFLPQQTFKLNHIRYYKPTGIDSSLSSLSRSEYNLPINMPKFLGFKGKESVPRVQEWSRFLPADINENYSLEYFGDKRNKILGHLLVRDGKGEMRLTKSVGNSIPVYVTSIIKPINLSAARQELNPWINLPNLNGLTIHSEVKTIPGVNMVKVPGIIKYNNINNFHQLYKVNIQEFIARQWHENPMRYIFSYSDAQKSGLNWTLKSLVINFSNIQSDWFFDENELSGRDRELILQQIEKEVYDNICLYPKGFSGSREILPPIKRALGTYNVFGYGDADNDLIILAKSNRTLMEWMPSGDCTTTLELVPKIELNFKQELWEFLESDEFRTAVTPGQRALVLWLDNFSIEMAYFSNITYHNGERYNLHKWHYILCRDREGNFKNNFNLWNYDDQVLFSRGLHEFRNTPWKLRV
jgi:hypothetical protein